ncbi:streptococcal hemagglutinin-like [Palaemon carinicauda]|uniref:streptococcal hemagglutinin-like n=1 Tax=Palaemon carinicauda TaxID=392227 RepID=UPI0035B66C6C
MATWISLVVLSLAVVSTLGFPRPEEYHIPDVGQGSRAQYYVLHSDGTYKYGYNTGDGAYEQSMIQAPGEVSGAFGYKDPTGADIKLEYTANERGFVPHGAHLPAQPDNHFGLKITEEPRFNIRKDSPPITPLAVESHSSSSANVSVEPAVIKSSASDDGSYSFSYETSSSSRSESADAQNSVSGHYSFEGDDGISHGISYIAGSETGYIAEGDSLPRGHAVPGAESGIPTGNIIPVLSEEEANALASVLTNVSPQTSASVTTEDAASSEETSSEEMSSEEMSSEETDSCEEHHTADDNVSQHEHHTSTAEDNAHFTETESPSDSSYFFKYDAGDSARLESADTNLNIKGNYRFVVPEGLQYTVRYTAGSDTGFVTSIKEETPTSDINSNSAPAQCQEVPATTGDTVLPEGKPTGGGHTDHPIESNENGDAAATASHADTNVYGRVVGHQTYVDQLGNEHKITYITAPNTYINLEEYDNPIPDKGIHSDTSTEISGKVGQLTYIDNNGTEYAITYVAPSTTSLNSNEYPITIPNGVIDINAVNADPDGNVVGHQTYIDQNGNEYKITYIVTPQEYSPSSTPDSEVTTDEAHSSSSPGDGSYTFSYDTSKSSRFESADAANSVTGHYSFIADDGIKRKIDYKASAETGYVAQGDSLPVGPSVPGAENGIPTGHILSEEESHAHGSVYSSGDTDSVQESNENADKTEAPAKTDVNGEVVGHGTYVDQNGTRYGIIYVAPILTGFNQNTHPIPYPRAIVDTITDDNDTLSPITPSAEDSQTHSGSSVTVSQKRAEITQQDPATSSSTSHSIRKVGDVLLHQYDPTNRDKYGYVYTAIH